MLATGWPASRSPQLPPPSRDISILTFATPLPGSQLWHQRYDELLTHDYSCYDCLHSVLPTKLPREQFYQQFANLYRQTDLGPYYDLVRQGKLTIENCKRGKEMLEAMTRWEMYLRNDPVLGKREGRRRKLETVKE